jgi:esterase/lipase superfamily enzyme
MALRWKLMVGRNDPFLANNSHLSEHLNRRGIGHEFHVWGERAALAHRQR